MTDNLSPIEERMVQINRDCSTLHLGDDERDMFDDAFNDLKQLLLTVRLANISKSGEFASSFLARIESRLFDRLSNISVYVAEGVAGDCDYRHYYNLFSLASEIERTALKILKEYESIK